MEDGGFQNDVRMTYCASVVMSVINRFEVDIDNAIGYVRRCKVSDPFCPEVVWLMIDLGRRLFLTAGRD